MPLVFRLVLGSLSSMEARWALTVVRGKDLASILVSIFNSIRVCVLLMEARRWWLLADEIKSFPPSPRFDGVYCTIDGRVEMCLRQILRASVSFGIRQICLVSVFFCVFTDWILLYGRKQVLLACPTSLGSSPHVVVCIPTLSK